jgi:hypothetical protein
MKFGDLVEYDLRASHGGKIERAYVLGEMFYSDDGSHVLLGNPGQLGMPIHSGHCKVISSGHETICAPLRKEYERRWPDGLKSNG